MRADARKDILLSQIQQFLVVEAEAVGSLLEVFLPLYSHRLALRTDVVVVRGGRGAGKSALFRVVNELGDSARVRSYFGDVPDATWVEAFSDGIQHPQQADLDAFAGRASDEALRAFWMTHLLRRIAAAAPEATGELPGALGPGWSLESAKDSIGEAARLLDRTESRLAAEGRTVFATYDHLDRLGQFDRQIRQRFVSTLLAQWLSLSNRYRHLRSKIFLREDLFEIAQSAFPDAGKLRGRSTSIEWDVPSLYRLVVRYMAACSQEVRDWLAGVPGLSLTPWGEFGYLPPEMDETLQRAFAERLAGKLMGHGVKKGYTYRWIPNRLQDGRGRIVPRSVLNLIGYACEKAHAKPLTKGARLLTPQDLWAALTPTSKARASEVSEEFPLVKRLDWLRGEQVLLDRDLVVRRLGQPRPDEEARGNVRGEDVFEELVRLGVLVVRDDRYGMGRVDVPDLYRYGFGILRKGGVRRAT